MPGFSNSVEASILNHLLNGSAWSAPAQTWIGLFVGDPETTGAEMTDPLYDRVRVLPDGGGTPAWTTAAVDGVGYIITNAAEIAFPTMSEDSGSVTHFGIWNSGAGGTLLFSGALDTPRTFHAGDTPKFAAGALGVRCE